MSYDVFTSLFQVQATVATLSVTIVSLISGTISERIANISFTKYVLEYKKYVFKPKHLFAFNLSSIIAEYICVTLKFNWFGLWLFVATVLSTIVLFKDIYYSFSNKNEIYREIEEYIVRNYTEESLSELIKKANSDLAFNNKIEAEQNINLMLCIFENELKGNQRVEIISACESFCSNNLKTQSDLKNIENVKLIIDTIFNIYEKANKSNYPLSLFDDCYHNWFNALCILPEDYIKYESLIFTYWKLAYENIKYDYQEEADRYVAINSHRLKYFLAHSYYEVYLQTPSDGKSESTQGYVFQVFYILQQYYSSSEYDVQKEILLLTIYNLAYSVITNGDAVAFEAIIFETTHNNDISVSTILYIITYLYYLLVAEKISDNCVKELKKKANSLIKTVKLDLDLFSDKYFNLNSDIYMLIDEKIVCSEYVPMGEAKTVVTDGVFGDVLLYLNLCQFNTNKDKLLDFIKNYNSLYSPFVGYSRYVKDFELFLSSFKKFIKLCFSEYESHFTDDFFDITRENIIYVISRYYSEISLEKLEKKKLTANEFSGISDRIEKHIYSYLHDELGMFNLNHNEIELNDFKTVTLFSMTSQVDFFDDDKKEKVIYSYINRGISNAYLSLIWPNVLIDKISQDSLEKQKSIINLAKQNNIVADCILTYKDIFYKEDPKDLLHDFSKDMYKIKDAYANNIILLIDSTRIGIILNDIRVEITDYSDEEIFEDCTNDNSGMLNYKMQDGIVVPFTEEEVKKYVHNTYKHIKVTGKAGYAFKGGIVGVGLKIERG